MRSPLDVDAYAREHGVDIGDVRALIPPECHVISPARSWFALLVAFIRLAAAELVLYHLPLTSGLALLWQIPALLAALLFAGWTFTGLFVLGHDCAHMAFSERRWVNVVVGYVTLSPEFTGFHNWRIWHNFHHAKTQLRGQDPDWAEKMMTRAEFEKASFNDKAHVRLGFGTPLGLLVGFWVGMFRRTFMKSLAPQIPLGRGAARELFTSTLIMAASVGAISYTLMRLGGPWVMVKHYYIPAFIAAGHGALLTYLHHSSPDALVFDRAGWTPFRGQVVSTFNVRFPRWIEALWFDINIHLPHHLAPKIPWYNLRAAAAAIAKARPEVYIERRFSFGYLWACWSKPLLKEPDAGGSFAMTSFAESAKAPRDGSPLRQAA
jgi:omega-6 fatty acid desaturase (delta-12 desaturase)